MRFHADLHITAAAPADPADPADGTLGGIGTLLLDPGASGILVRSLMIATDTAMRICVGSADQDGQRLRAANFAANGGVATAACWEGFAGAKVIVFHGAQGVVDVAIEGEYLG